MAENRYSIVYVKYTDDSDRDECIAKLEEFKKNYNHHDHCDIEYYVSNKVYIVIYLRTSLKSDLYDFGVKYCNAQYQTVTHYMPNCNDDINTIIENNIYANFIRIKNDNGTLKTVSFMPNVNVHCEMIDKIFENVNIELIEQTFMKTTPIRDNTMSNKQNNMNYINRRINKINNDINNVISSKRTHQPHQPHQPHQSHQPSQPSQPSQPHNNYHKNNNRNNSERPRIAPQKAPKRRYKVDRNSNIDYEYMYEQARLNRIAQNKYEERKAFFDKYEDDDNNDNNNDDNNLNVDYEKLAKHVVQLMLTKPTC